MATLLGAVAAADGIGDSRGPRERRASELPLRTTSEASTRTPGASRAGASGVAAADTPAATGELVLFSYPLLVDEGRLSEGATALKEALEERPFVEVHPADAERLGLVDDEPARIRTQAGEAELPVRVTDRVVQGSVFVPYNQPGFAANTILSGSLITRASIEPVKARAEVAS
jgi:anaerobic selenocysteine-containing dehydrogenase